MTGTQRAQFAQQQPRASPERSRPVKGDPRTPRDSPLRLRARSDGSALPAPAEAAPRKNGLRGSTSRKELAHRDDPTPDWMTARKYFGNGAHRGDSTPPWMIRQGGQADELDDLVFDLADFDEEPISLRDD